MNTHRILKALWNVRNGSDFEYQEAINFGIAIGMASMLPYEQHVRLGNLAKNASDYARKDRTAKREARKVAA